MLCRLRLFQISCIIVFAQFIGIALSYAEKDSVKYKSLESEFGEKYSEGYSEEVTAQLIGQKYISFSQSDLRGRFQTQAKFQYKGITRNGQLKFATNTDGMVATAPLTPWYVNVSEAYTGYDLNDRGQVTLGRKRQDWSALDRYWELGIFEPRFRWDCLHPSYSGLTGGFFEYEAPKYRVMAFASVVYIPELGSQFTLKDGKFSSKSPCFEAPSNQILVLNQLTDVSYSVNQPKISDFLSQPSFGGSIKGGGNTGFFVGVAYVYKPLNQLLLGYDGQLVLNSATDPLEIQILPRITYHHTGSFEVGVRSENWGTVLGMMGEVPVKDKLGATQTGQFLESALAISPMTYYRFPLFYESEVQIGYLKVLGGETITEGSLSGAKVASDSHYFSFEALKIDFYTSFSESFHFHQMIVQDYTVQGSFLSSTFEVGEKDNQLSFNVGADFLGVGSVEQAKLKSTLIGRYRGNDRVYGGVKYVF